MTGRILVTGGNGRLGRSILTALGDRGVAGVRHRDSGETIFIDAEGRVDPVQLDGIAAIINCAGRVSGTLTEIKQANIIYPITLARRARAAGINRFIQVSSFSVFGKTELIDASSAIAPDSDYGSSKVMAERELGALTTNGFRSVPLRLPFMFSATEPALLGRLVSMMLRLRVLPTLSKGPGRRSMITYAAAADALIALAVSSDVPEGTLAAADPLPLDLTAIAEAIREHLGKRIAILPVPEALVTFGRAFAPGIIDRLFRSSVLAPSVNMLKDHASHPVAAELGAYLDSLKS